MQMLVDKTDLFGRLKENMDLEWIVNKLKSDK